MIWLAFESFQKLKKLNKSDAYYSHKGFPLDFSRGKVGVIFKHTHWEKGHIAFGCEFELADLSNHYNKMWAVGTKPRSNTEEMLCKVTTSGNLKVRLDREQVEMKGSLRRKETREKGEEVKQHSASGNF